MLYVLVLVRTFPFSLTCAQKDNLDDGDHPFHLHGHRPWMYVPYILTVVSSYIAISDVLLKPEWVQEQDGITGKS